MAEFFKGGKKNIILYFPRSALIIADSEIGKNNILNRYGIDQERIISIPFSPAKGTMINEKTYQKNFIDIKAKYNLDMEYVFYPAQFWSHKNHLFILEGVHRLELEHDILIAAVFVERIKGIRDT